LFGSDVTNYQLPAAPVHPCTRGIPYFLYIITNHPPLLRSCYQHPASRDTNTSLYVVLRTRLRPPGMAEVSKMHGAIFDPYILYIITSHGRSNLFCLFRGITNITRRSHCP
jgi:hypothetical protein